MSFWQRCAIGLLLYFVKLGVFGFTYLVFREVGANPAFAAGFAAVVALMDGPE